MFMIHDETSTFIRRVINLSIETSTKQLNIIYVCIYIYIYIYDIYVCIYMYIYMTQDLHRKKNSQSQGTLRVLIYILRVLIFVRKDF